MLFLQIILLSGLFTAIFVLFHFLFLYLFSFNLVSFSRSVQQTTIPFILGNLICFYVVRDLETHKVFYNSFIINFAIFIIYVEFLSLIKTGFTLAIINSFKKRKKLFKNEFLKVYSNGRGAKWIFFDRLNTLVGYKLIKLNKKITLSQFGYFLSIILIFLRKILAIKNFG
tara:strand:- start:1240 stop:1749 length:510 start_codon:yes stop_codon:yes gene_type:complete